MAMMRIQDDDDTPNGNGDEMNPFSQQKHSGHSSGHCHECELHGMEVLVADADSIDVLMVPLVDPLINWEVSIFYVHKPMCDVEEEIVRVDQD